MAPSSAWDVYAKELSTLRYGYPLWHPEPQGQDGEILIGDVGLIDKGRFLRMFNATLPPTHGVNLKYGVPGGDDFEPFQYSRLGDDFTFRETKDTISKGPLLSSTMKTTNIHGEATIPTHGSGLNIDYHCTSQRGAVLVLPTQYASSEEILQSNIALRTYIKKNSQQWFDFALEKLSCDTKDLVFITGWTKTSDWALAAFLRNSDALHVSFDADMNAAAKITLSAAKSRDQCTIPQYRLSDHQLSSSSSASTSLIFAMRDTLEGDRRQHTATAVNTLTSVSYAAPGCSDQPPNGSSKKSRKSRRTRRVPKENVDIAPGRTDSNNRDSPANPADDHTGTSKTGPSSPRERSLDQSIFVRSFRLRNGGWRRLLGALEMKGGAGPHKLPDPEPDLEPCTLNSRDDGSAFEVEIDPFPPEVEEPCDNNTAILDYILSDSRVCIAITSDEDVYEIVDRMFDRDNTELEMAEFLKLTLPVIDVCNNVGTLAVALDFFPEKILYRCLEDVNSNCPLTPTPGTLGECMAAVNSLDMTLLSPQIKHMIYHELRVISIDYLKEERMGEEFLAFHATDGSKLYVVRIERRSCIGKKRAGDNIGSSKLLPDPTDIARSISPEADMSQHLLRLTFPAESLVTLQDVCTFYDSIRQSALRNKPNNAHDIWSCLTLFNEFASMRGVREALENVASRSSIPAVLWVSRGTASTSHLSLIALPVLPSNPRAAGPLNPRSSSRMPTYPADPPSPAASFPLSLTSASPRRPSFDNDRPSLEQKWPSIDRRRPSIDQQQSSVEIYHPSVELPVHQPTVGQRQTSANQQRATASGIPPPPPRVTSPTTTVLPSAASPTPHNDSYQNWFYNTAFSGPLALSVYANGEHRELIRSATSVLCKEILRCPSQLDKSNLGAEMEARIRALTQLERVCHWEQSGVDSPSQLSSCLITSGVSSSKEERERRLFAEALKDGLLLCHFLNKLFPLMISRIDHNEDGHIQTSNVTRFLASCSSVGLRSEELFERDDLLGRSPSALALARVAKTILVLHKTAESLVSLETQVMHRKPGDNSSSSRGPYHDGPFARIAAASLECGDGFSLQRSRWPTSSPVSLRRWSLPEPPRRYHQERSRWPTSSPVSLRRWSLPEPPRRYHQERFENIFRYRAFKEETEERPTNAGRSRNEHEQPRTQVSPIKLGKGKSPDSFLEFVQAPLNNGALALDEEELPQTPTLLGSGYPRKRAIIVGGDSMLEYVADPLRQLSKPSSSDLLSRDSTDGVAGRQITIVREEGKPATRFQLGYCIGRGQSGAVYWALNLNTSQMVAVKRIQLESLKEEDILQLMREFDLVKSLSHPTIVKYEGMVRDENVLSIVLELAENGSLGHTLAAFGKVNESLVASYVVKILAGLGYLHRRDVVHSHLKAANILTTKNGDVKLSYFGVSFNLRVTERKMMNMAGTPNWMAPEVIGLKGASIKSDIWSLGCTIIELLTGRPPYADIDDGMSVMFRILEDDMPPLPEGASESLRDFLTLCFQKDPVNRPSAEILCEHEWLNNPSLPLDDQVRTQDNIPKFLRKARTDLQKLATMRSFADIDTPDGDTKSTGSDKVSRMDHRLSRAPTRRGMSNDPEPIFPREHSFVHTQPGKPVICRVCQKSIKKSAVLCEQCSLIAHIGCALHALPICDLRSQLLLQDMHFADSGSPTIATVDVFEDIQPGSPTADSMGAPRANTDFSQLSSSLSLGTGVHSLNAVGRAKSTLPAVQGPSSTPTRTVTHDSSVSKDKEETGERPASIASASTLQNSSSMRSNTMNSRQSRMSVVEPGRPDRTDSGHTQVTSTPYSMGSSADTDRDEHHQSAEDRRRHGSRKRRECVVQ